MYVLHFSGKKDDSRQKGEVLRTGGGTPPKNVTQETEQVLAVLGNGIQDNGNPYDRDTMSSQGK